jgi:RNA polymerase sigma factor (sigma-70 family)
MAKAGSTKAETTEPFDQCTGGDTSALSSEGSTASTKAAKIARRKSKTPGIAGMTTRDSLLSAIKDPENKKSWTEFYDIYTPFIRKIGMRKGMDAQRAEDLVIIVMREVNKMIGTFKRNPEKKAGFRVWLKTIVKRRAIDIWRKDKRFPLPIMNKPHNDSGMIEENATDRVEDNRNALEELWDADEAKAILKLANGITKQRVSLRQWQLFENRILRKWSVERIGQTFGVTPNTVFLAVYKIRPVYEAAIIEAKDRLDRGPLSPLDKKALDESLPLPSYYVK